MEFIHCHCKPYGPHDLQVSLQNNNSQTLVKVLLKQL